MPLSDDLSKLFRDAMDWGRSYGQRLGTTYELLDEVAEQFADKAREIEAATAAPLIELIEAEKSSRIKAQEENISLKDACLKAESQAQRVPVLLDRIAQLQRQLEMSEAVAAADNTLHHAINVAQQKCAVLEAQLAEARSQMERQKDEWLSWGGW